MGECILLYEYTKNLIFTMCTGKSHFDSMEYMQKTLALYVKFWKHKTYRIIFSCFMIDIGNGNITIAHWSINGVILTISSPIGNWLNAKPQPCKGNVSISDFPIPQIHCTLHTGNWHYWSLHRVTVPIQICTSIFNNIDHCAVPRQYYSQRFCVNYVTIQ